MTAGPINCISCKTELNEGAKRCSACGRFVGWKGYFFNYASWFGAIASVISLITIAVTLYLEVLAPKRPDLTVRVSEATFRQITNLTCNPDNLDGAKPLTPSTYGSPPGNTLLIEGTIQNTGTLAGELRFTDGHITFRDDERIARPLARFHPDTQNARYFVPAGNTISFSVTVAVFRDNSDGFYVSELELDPMEVGRKHYMRERIKLNYYTYRSGQRYEETANQAIDFYLEPKNETWRVDGGLFRHLC